MPASLDIVVVVLAYEHWTADNEKTARRFFLLFNIGQE
jgi:hypothetical protein